MLYDDFIENKHIMANSFGFEPYPINSMLFDFQKDIVDWALRKGRAAIFADCGLGKTPMQLEWSDQVCRKTGGKVLILTPLSVGHQTIQEAEKFGIEAYRSHDGTAKTNITITNYERLHMFNEKDFVGVVCDESSILKNFNGVRRKDITEFMRKKKYRLLCTATASPNDYIELGTSAEALGVMGYTDMLTKFFRNQQNSVDTKRYYTPVKWRFKKHAKKPFWQWVCSWARALRRPSDMGYPDDGFILPPLKEKETVVPYTRQPRGELFVLPARNLREQRQERRETIDERCTKVADLLNQNSIAVAWCHLNDESKLLSNLIPDAKEITGSMSDDEKEEVFVDFYKGNVRVLVTKPKIGAFGLNWQHCHHMTFFPSHSYEQYYQAVRRCWRFGQKSPVTVDIVRSEGESAVMDNLRRKSKQADEMFTHLVGFMNDAISIKQIVEHKKKARIPSWLLQTK